jgi:ribokinase
VTADESAATRLVDVCVVGSANLDIVASAARLPSPGETVLGTSYAEHAGGKGLNQAVAAARAGARTAFVATVGADDAGQRLLAEVAAAGVDVSYVARSTRPTGRAVITVDARGENSIVVVAGANADVTSVALPPARVVLVQLEVPIDVVVTALEHGRAAGATTILNPAPAAPLDAAVLGLVDVLVPNEHELALIGEPEALVAAGVRAVVTTRGAAGIRVVTAERSWHQAPFAVTPVDTTGAGDACCGALAARVAAGDPFAAAVRFAAAAGALATTRHGAVPSIPDRSAIEALLDDRRRQ